MQIIKYLYRAKFEWFDVVDGPIFSYPFYAATSEETKVAVQKIAQSRARGLDYIGVERLPFGLVISSCSAPYPPTIMVDVEPIKE